MNAHITSLIMQRKPEGSCWNTRSERFCLLPYFIVTPVNLFYFLFFQFAWQTNMQNQAGIKASQKSTLKSSDLRIWTFQTNKLLNITLKMKKHLFFSLRKTKVWCQCMQASIMLHNMRRKKERKCTEVKLSVIHSPSLRHFDHTLFWLVCDEKEKRHSSSLVLLQNSEQIIRVPPANQRASLRQSRERSANRKRERTLEGRGERGDKEEFTQVRVPH